MAFKIESFEALRNIAGNVEDKVNELNAQKEKVNGALSNLQTNIVCDGITEILGSLENAISEATKQTNYVLKKSGKFILSQTGYYEEKTEAFSSNLSTTESNLENV